MQEIPPVLRFLDPPSGGPRAEDFSKAERAVLDTVNQKVAASPTLDDLMDFIFEAVVTIYPCDRIGLSFLEDEGRRVTAHWCRAAYGPVLLQKGYSEDISQSSLRTVLESNQPRIIYDLEDYSKKRPGSHSSAILVREGVRSSLTCNLSVEGKTFGLLFLSSRTSNSYTPHHVWLWLAIAERIGQAVEKAWRIEQLTAANQAYGEMLGFVSHELKSPLASMIMDARVLADGYLGAMDPKQIDKLERLMKKGEFLLDLVREYLDLARMEGGEMPLHPREARPLEDLLEPAIEMVSSQLEEKQQRLERIGEDAEPVECDPELMKIVLVNLLSNASKYGNQGGLIRVEYGRDKTGFSFSVYNEGPGFPTEERPRLFRKFSRLQAPKLIAQKGTGVGLYTAWRIVRMHGGTIDATSAQGEWAEFSVTIPQPITTDPTSR
jgi:signal transduction histidine kinase